MLKADACAFDYVWSGFYVYEVSNYFWSANSFKKNHKYIQIHSIIFVRKTASLAVVHIELPIHKGPRR